MVLPRSWHLAQILAAPSTRPTGTDSLKILVLLVVPALVLSGCRKSEAPAFERPPAPVSTAETVARDVPLYLDEIGRCVAREMVAIRPQVSGQLVAIHFEDGADVKVGDPLFTIDPRPFQAVLESAEAELTQAQAELDLARLQFARVVNLVETKAIAQEVYDERKNAVDVAEARVKLEEAELETARLDLEYCTIRSPIDGRTGQRLVDVGNIVMASIGVASEGSPLLVIQRLDPVYADFTIAEKDLDLVRRHMAQGPLAVEVRMPDEPDASADPPDSPDPPDPIGGELTFLDNAVQEGTGTVKLRATVPNPDHRLWPGRFVRVRLILSTLPDAVLVSAEAPQLSANGPFVYVVHDDSTAELRLVTTGQRHGELLVVEEGLEPGERVVVAGQLGVTPGGKVRLAEPDAAPASPVVGTH